MRFGQNVLRIARKARFVQFSWKAYCFHVLALISVPWAIFGFGTLKNAIWPKCPPHGLKSTFCTNFMESLLFSVLSWILVRLSDFWLWNVEKCDLVRTSSALPEKHVLYNFHRKPTVFTYWRKFQSRWANFGSKTLRNAIWSKRSQHCRKSTFWTIFLESLLFLRIGVNFCPVERFLALKRWKMRFGENVLRMAWKAVLYKFHGKPTVFSIVVNFSPVERFLALKR